MRRTRPHLPLPRSHRTRDRHHPRARRRTYRRDRGQGNHQPRSQRCVDAIGRNDQRVLRLLGGDGVVVRGVRVLRLVPSASQTIDRLEAGHAGELRVHRFDDHDVAASRRPAQTLMSQQRARCFPCCVIGEGERSLRVVGRCSSAGCDVTTGRLDEPLDGCRVSRHPLKLSSVEQALDDFASLVPPRHLAEGIGPQEAAMSELVE